MARYLCGMSYIYIYILLWYPGVYCSHMLHRWTYSLGAVTEALLENGLRYFCCYNYSLLFGFHGYELCSLPGNGTCGRFPHFLLSDSYGLLFVERPLWRKDGSVFCIRCWSSPGSLSRVLLPWDSWQYFTVSNLRLPFSSPLTTRRVKVEVFDPASTRVSGLPSLSLSLMLRPRVSRPVCLGIKHPSGAYDQILITVWQLLFYFCGASSLTRGRVCLFTCYWPSPVQSFLGLRPFGQTPFYCWNVFTESLHSKDRGADSIETSHVIPSQRIYWCTACCPATSSNTRTSIVAFVLTCLLNRCQQWITIHVTILNEETAWYVRG
jgi:hypothetical protein